MNVGSMGSFNSRKEMSSTVIQCPICWRPASYDKNELF